MSLNDTNSHRDETRRRDADTPSPADAPGQDRRDFLKVAGFSLAALAIPGCSRAPTHEAVPFVDAPEDEAVIGRVEGQYPTVADDDPCGLGPPILTWSLLRGPPEADVLFHPSGDVPDPCAIFSAPGVYDLLLRVRDSGTNESAPLEAIGLTTVVVEETHSVTGIDRKVARYG